MSVSPDPRLKAITDKEWKDITLRLFKYAQYKCRLLPGHMEPGDMACEAMQLAFTGERKWNTDKNPDVLDFLKDIVDSRWWNLWRKKAHRRLTSDETMLNVALENLSIEKHENDIALTTDAGAECGHEMDYRLKLIEVAAQGDPELEEFYLALEYGCNSIKEIAAMLEWTVSRTYKVRTKLTNKLEEKQV